VEKRPWSRVVADTDILILLKQSQGGIREAELAGLLPRSPVLVHDAEVGNRSLPTSHNAV
jgi:hypothetical protein